MIASPRSWNTLVVMPVLIAFGATALTGFSGLPDNMASTMKLVQAYTFSAGVKPGSPQPGSMVAASASLSRAQPCSTSFTLLLMPCGTIRIPWSQRPQHGHLRVSTSYNISTLILICKS